jgi:hypothetical protein
MMTPAEGRPEGAQGLDGWQPDEPMAGSPASGDEQGPELRLIRLIDSMLHSGEEAVSLAAEIGPEWENVVIDIQGVFSEQLVELRKRVYRRMTDPPARPD